MLEIVAIAILALVCVAQTYVIIRLVDRVMSRNYYDFKISDRIPKKEDKQQNGMLRVEPEEDDLGAGYLSDFS